MHESGYFRDSYNDSNLLWRFGLSWWADVGPLLDGPQQRLLAPAKAAELLALLDERAARFTESLNELAPEEVGYFLEKRRAFTDLLRHAIELGEPIDCSI
jgi:hypothetical protein